MATTVEHPVQSVRVHDAPHELRIEITLPEGDPHVLVATRGRELEIRVFRPLEPVVPWHASPDATPV
jgi:hypothetical protein